MSDFSITRAAQLLVPVLGPIKGFYNHNDSTKNARIYTVCAAIGSGLTALTGLALAAIGIPFAQSLFVFGVIGLIYNIKKFNDLEDAGASAPRANQAFQNANRSVA